MIQEAQDHENRSRAIADSMRRFMVGLHTGGITLVIYFAGTIINATESGHGITLAVGLISGPILVFMLGLIATGLSIQFAKHREIKRRDAVLREECPPVFNWYVRSWTWEWISLGLFASGVLCALAQWW